MQDTSLKNITSNHNIIMASIDDSDLISGSDKKIIKALLVTNQKVSTNFLMDVLSDSKQNLYIKLRRLIKRGYISRIKDRVYLYQLEEQKLQELLDMYMAKQKIK